MPQKPCVLVVDDNAMSQAFFFEELQSTFDVLEATTVDEFKTFLKEKADKITHVAIDGDFLGSFPGQVDAISFLELVLEELIVVETIAISSSHEKNKIFLDAGCEHSCIKKDFPQFILKLWNEEQEALQD